MEPPVQDFYESFNAIIWTILLFEQEEQSVIVSVTEEKPLVRKHG